MTVKVHLVDGTFELFRCFQGAPRHRNAEGEEVGAVRGLLHTLLSLLKADDVTHVAVAFDALPPPRGPAAADEGNALIRRQAPLALEAVRGLGICLWPMVRFQADDALASGARFLGEDDAVKQVVLCTADTDLFQCLRGTRVVALNRIRKQVVDEAAFRDRYGIAPGQFPDFLALVGAPSKGLPGIAGCGRKTAAALLRRYGSLEELPTSEAEWKGSPAFRKRAFANWQAQRDEALLVKRLATLRNDLPLDCSLATLRWRALNERKLNAVIAGAEAHDLRERIDRWQR